MSTTNATTSQQVSPRERRNQQLAREAAAEGIVLLENNGILPMAPQPVALFGAGAEFTGSGGSGSGEVNARYEISVREGLENAGFQITSEDWLRRYRKTWEKGKQEFIEAARKKVKLSRKTIEDLLGEEYRDPAGDPITKRDGEGCGVGFYVVSRQSGEGGDRRDEEGSFRLTGQEVQDIRFCAETFASFVLILNTGAPIDLSPIDPIDGVDAIVYMGQLGMEGGNALSDVLTGKVTPSGKLALTWPMSYADVPFGEEYGLSGSEHAVYKEGIFVGYRYYDSFHVKPRYPFGYGRSYTAFEVRTEQVTVCGTEVRCSVLVQNKGDCSGKETVQIYAGGPKEGLVKEAKRLVAFAKTKTLKPGASETLCLSFPAAALSVYEEKNAETILEPGAYQIRVGTSSADSCPEAVIRLAERIVLFRHRNLCASAAPVMKWSRNDIDSLKRNTDLSGPKKVQNTLTLSASDFTTHVFDYTEKETPFSEKTKTHLRRFTGKDMARFCAGTGYFGQNPAFSVPGAAGHTTSAYASRGIPNVELCDGPAGLRVQKRSARSKNGRIKPVDPPISVYEYLPKLIRKFLLGNPEKDEVLYQFATAFPVAAMLAQTWNTNLAEAIGRAVSEEMCEYGARVWLAPALNIVRNPLCGRNYEYFSEDPLLSGKMAAAVTRGVQERPENAVTLKHFAANNQEENRFASSSDVDERTLREIYLKGFEIAVREGAPRCVMTAYNKINGTYCANSKELCTDILRNEWGFKGVVMTDWYAVSPGRGEEGKAIEAGVDLIMPGGSKTVRKLTKHSSAPSFAKALKVACGRVLDLILSPGERF